MNLTFEKFKIAREKYNVPVPDICAKCGKKFKDDTKLYRADKIDNNEIKSVVICPKCANKTSDKD